jgi:NADPH-dependent 2,4-dienoyl-CoA reductase/sulfur reductase-like enzyme
VVVLPKVVLLAASAHPNAGHVIKFSPDVVVVGAGPTGLACGIEAKRAGLSVVNIDKGYLQPATREDN